MIHVPEKKLKWWVLFALTSAISMIFIDISILPIALPTIQHNLNLSDGGLHWIVNAYTLALTIFFLAGGRFGDMHGHKQIFLYGLLIFALGSIFCGVSYGEKWFIFSRFVQGIGGAMLGPTSTALIFNVFPLHQRGKALGIYTGMGAIFLALGPFLGGFLTEYFNWRYIFWVNLPIAIVGFSLTYLIVPKIPKQSVPFDWTGFIASSLGISLITIGLMQVKIWGWFSLATVGMLISGATLLWFLWKLDRKVKDPYLDFTLFKSRNFIGANLAIFALQFILMGSIYWAIYFQTVFHYTPMKAGIMTLISNLPLLGVAPLGGHLMDKHGPRIPIFIGYSLIILSLVWFLINIENPNMWIILSSLLPFGIGIPLIFTPSFTAALVEIPAHRRGIASGTTAMLRQFGATLGLAIIGTVFITIQNNQFSMDLKKTEATQELHAEEFQGLLSKKPEALEQLNKLPEKIKLDVEKKFLDSYVNAFKAINFISLGVSIFALIAFMGLIKMKTQPKIKM